MEVDCWANQPRLWLGGHAGSASVSLWEEDGGSLKKILNFDEEARKEAGANYLGRWSGGFGDKVICDARRGQLYFHPWGCLGGGRAAVFDMKTGGFLFWVELRAAMDDIAFDKRGHLHCQFNNLEQMRNAVGRLDPSRKQYAECPYDYGEEGEYIAKGWIGVLATWSQHKFSDGIGVNMMGDVAVVNGIYRAPRMDDLEGLFKSTRMEGKRAGTDDAAHESFIRNIREMEKRGVQQYYIPRRPGLASIGETIWTFDRSGELRQESAVIAPFLLNGVQLDEDGRLYFAQCATKVVNGKPFLQGRGGNFGCEKPLVAANRNPLTGTFIKSRPKDVRLLLKNASIPLDADQLPKRPYDANSIGKGPGWWEGTEWLYAGASPAVDTDVSACECPQLRSHLDWYKRSFVPEAYRHSIGVLDTNGNLIMHLGRYGNFDDAGRMKPGDADIALTMPRFISGTDNYLAFSDWGERLVALKIAYEAEETVGIGNQ